MRLPLIMVLAALVLAGSSRAATGERLDRSRLVQTFNEPCTAPHLETRFKTNFISGTQAGYGSDGSRSLAPNHELEIYVDPAYPGQLNPDAKTGYTPPALGLQPFASGGGECSITARRSPPSILGEGAGFKGKYPYTSGLLSTQGRFAQLYGYFEITLRAPAVRGTWPAFWLLPTDGSWPPEADVVEILGHQPGVAYFTAHPGEPTHSSTAFDASKRPVTFGLLWTKTRLTWFENDREVASELTPAAMNKPMYVLVNMAVGGPGSWPGPPDAASVFPATLYFSNLRIFAVH